MATEVQRDHIRLSITDDQPPPQPATPTTVERSTSRCNPRFVAGFLKDHIKISLFLCFNSILPLTDVLTDSLTSFELNESGHIFLVNNELLLDVESIHHPSSHLSL